MLVENCCQALLAEILPSVTLHRKTGYAIEIGCGTFAFYCELFDQLNLPAIAVEPLPVKNLRKLCKRRNIPLVEACIAEKDGTIDLYMGNYLGSENLNLNSTRQSWWGATEATKKVNAMTMKSLIDEFFIEEISCLKIDIEGAEYSVLSQLSSLSRKLMPKVIMFEYGGGGTFESRQGGWAEEFLQDTVNILHLLKKLGYRQLIQIDSEKGFQEKSFDLKNTDLDSATLFSPGNVYGNIITLHCDEYYPEDRIQGICKKYNGNHLDAPALKISESFLKRVSIRIRQLIYG